MSIVEYMKVWNGYGEYKMDVFRILELQSSEEKGVC